MLEYPILLRAAPHTSKGCPAPRLVPDRSACRKSPKPSRGRDCLARSDARLATANPGERAHRPMSRATIPMAMHAKRSGRWEIIRCSAQGAQTRFLPSPLRGHRARGPMPGLAKIAPWGPARATPGPSVLIGLGPNGTPRGFRSPGRAGSQPVPAPGAPTRGLRGCSGRAPPI